MEPVKFDGEIKVGIRGRSSLPCRATNENIWVTEGWVFHDLKKKRHDRIETLEAKVEAKEGFGVASEDCDEITDIRESIEGRLLGAEYVTDQHRTG